MKIEDIEGFLIGRFNSDLESLYINYKAQKYDLYHRLVRNLAEDILKLNTKNPKGTKK